MGRRRQVLFQVSGRKKIYFVAPKDGRRVGLNPILSELNLASTKTDLFNESPATFDDDDGTVYETVWEPREVIYWPPFWLHNVQILDDFNLAINVRISEINVNGLMIRQ
ncbi:MAG: cupin-like domain-containing protein [Pirellulaceae bacterium]|nr:cupin-like domain-containing protein [Pirellulaceae bacterium]